MKFFIITFDRETDKSYGLFHQEFVNHPRFYRWWHYIKSSYLVGTDLNANDIADHFTSVANKHGLRTTHLAIEVDLKHRQGMLPKEAWNWFKNNS